MREQTDNTLETAETVVRPLARLTARALSAEETARIAGGWTLGISNCGGYGDRDMMN